MEIREMKAWGILGVFLLAGCGTTIPLHEHETIYVQCCPECDESYCYERRIKEALDSCEGDDNFAPEYDSDGDTCITIADYAAWMAHCESLRED
jgi:hypothetical protein